MPLDAVANFVRGTMDAAIDATQTTVSVADATPIASESFVVPTASSALVPRTEVR